MSKGHQAPDNEPDSALRSLAELIQQPSQGDPEKLARLEDLVNELHAIGNHFAAGYGWEQGAMFAWGNPEAHRRAIRAATSEYIEAVDQADNCSGRGLAAYVRLLNLMGSEPPWGVGLAGDVVLAAMNELATIVLDCKDLVTGRAHLVRGLWIHTDFDTVFELVVPSGEVDPGVETGSLGRRRFALQSPFQLFIATADYVSAARVAELNPDAFTTPGLRAWRHAVRAYVQKEVAVEEFASASAEFASDVVVATGEPDAIEHWSSRNVDLWAPYFMARSHMALAVRDPAGVREHVASAAAEFPLEIAGWVDGEVLRFRALVLCLSTLIDPTAPASVESARRTFSSAVAISGPSESDTVTARFIDLADEALRGFAADPIRELTHGRLPKALALLDRLPLLEPGLTEVARSAVEDRVREVLLGPRNTIYEQLEAIKDERVLHRLLLRLVRVSLPAYAQIQHGPAEHGKDLVVVLERGASREVRMYQVKVGPLDTAKWRTAKQELEAMFEVPPSAFLTGDPQTTRFHGFLVSNGHAGPSVLPEVDGWIDIQRSRLGREFTFMHIDRLVRWIHDEYLVGEFRAFLRDEGLPKDGTDITVIIGSGLTGDA